MRHALPCLLLLVACKKDAQDTEETGEPDGTDLSTEVEPDTDPPVEPEVRNAFCGGIEPADAGPMGGRVTLTFDDGPDAEDTAELLALLDAENIPATFFIVGQQLDDPSSWPAAEDIVENPLFELANHSYDHANLARLSLGAVADQIDDTDALIDTFGQQTQFFRFPFGSSTCETADLVRERGHRITGWHIDTADWCYSAVGVEGVCLQDDYWRVPTEYEADMRSFILEQAARYDGGILLFHDIHAWTVDSMPDIIADLRGAGYTFVPLTDLDTHPNLNAGTPDDIPYLGEACDTANDLCFHSEYFSWCEPTDPDNSAVTTGVCTMPCEGLCPDRDGAAGTFCAETSAEYGQCLARSGDINEQCILVAGSVPTAYSRFVGDSSANASTATVCAPSSN